MGINRSRLQVAHEEAENILHDGRKRGMAAGSRDELKSRRGRNMIGRVGIQRRFGRSRWNSGRFVAHGLSCAGGIEERVETASLNHARARTGKGEHIRVSGDNCVRTGRGEFNPVRKVEAIRDKARDGLLAVLGANRRQQRVERCDVASNADGGNTLIERPNQRTYSASSRTAEGADTMRIDLGKLRKIVNATHRIPQNVAGKGVAD